MEPIARWAPMAIALCIVLAVSAWFVTHLLKAEPSSQSVLLALLRELPSLILLLLPLWLPGLMPTRSKHFRWVTLCCGALALGIAVSFGTVVVLRGEQFFVAVATVYAVGGVLHLYRVWLLSPLRSHGI